MKEHNLFCKRARGHERSEIKQTTVAKEAFVNVKTPLACVKINLRYSRTFCQLCSSTWHLDVILDSNPAGFRLYKWRHVYSNKMSEALLLR